MRDLGVDAAFQQIAEADQVGVDIRRRILQRISDSGLRRQMHHRIKAARAKHLAHGIAVGDVELAEFEGVISRQPLQARPL